MMTMTRVRVAGVGLILAMVGAFVLTGAFYTRAFSDVAEVTVQTARAGLIMGPGNKVKLRGVEIGRVGSVESTENGAELVLEIDRDQLSGIPANVTAAIRSSTVFGAKYVELVPGAEPVEARLAAGAVIDARSVTTEVNTVFDGLDDLLSGVDVTDLNSTLTVLARGLEGRGRGISELAATADAYLTRLEPLLPQVRRDLVAVARFARLGNQVSPALLRILENATVTGHTIATEQQDVHRLLVDLSILSQAGTRFVGVNDEALLSLLRSLRPTTGMLRAYATELPCLFQGLDRTQEIMTDTLGGISAGLRARLTVRSELPPYRPGVDKPQPAVPRGPTCAALPSLDQSQVPFPERGAPQ
jgi:phospholipid/cholesterol/gamma-HCH transport system substrate-binding protein